MKPAFYVAATLALAAGCAASQPASAPPIKMGLWEITMDTRRIEPPMFGTYKYQVCLTPETWRDVLAGRGAKGQKRPPGCNEQEIKQKGSEFSSDWACKKIPGNFDSSDQSGHSRLVILNPEKTRRKDRIEVLEPSGKGVLESIADSIYKGADCKGIAPGELRRISRPSAPSAGAASQPASALPVKMGLWELTMDPQATTANVSKALGLDPKTFTKRLCLTPETWRDLLAGMELESMPPGCDVNGLKQDASGFSYGWVCQGLRGNNSGRAQLDILNPEKVHLAEHAEFSDPPDHPKPTTVTMVYDIVHKGADCGNIAPGSAKRIK